MCRRGGYGYRSFLEEAICFVEGLIESAVFNKLLSQEKLNILRNKHLKVYEASTTEKIINFTMHVQGQY